VKTTQASPLPPPRKRFGQHFLHDPAVVARIVAAIRPGPGRRIVEIGPGRGVLTRELLEAAGELDVVEIDRDLARLLPDQLGSPGPALRIHCVDVLKFDLHALADAATPLEVVGNLPYNISSPLLFHLLEQMDCISQMVFMLQKEVVERIAAAPDSKAYGRLSVMVQYHCRVEHLFNVGPGAFTPPPRVESAVLRLQPAQRAAGATDRRVLSELVRRAFSTRRKTLRNSLRDYCPESMLAAAGIDPQRRAETLSVEEFVRLANLKREQEARFM
jgi:16S rRNA (adenine1518-N6/adenine1519-N6)-dimethyltransferase